MSSVPRSSPIPIPARKTEEYFVPWRQFSKGSNPADEWRTLPRARPAPPEQVAAFLSAVHHRCDYDRLRRRRRGVRFSPQDDDDDYYYSEQAPPPGADVAQPKTPTMARSKGQDDVEERCEKKEEVAEHVGGAKLQPKDATTAPVPAEVAAAKDGGRRRRRGEDKKAAWWLPCCIL